MPAAKDFIKAFERATERSSKQSVFNDMVAALGGTLNGGGTSISANLDTRGKGSDSRVVEDAIRKKFKDSLSRSRYPDAYFGEIPVEVKHTTSGFGKIPTDSYGIVDTDGKWYLYAKGSVDRTENDQFTIWLMRSDELYTEVLMLLQGTSQAPLFRNLPNSIDPSSGSALEDISKEIQDITASLSTAILRKARGDSKKAVEGDETSMSLHKRVGLNRVRFDVKFESLLRRTIASMLKG